MLNDRNTSCATAFSAVITLAALYIAQLAQQHGLAHFFSGSLLARFSSAGELLKLFGTRMVHAMADFAFSTVCLFFLYVNGSALARQIDHIGGRYLGPVRWRRYATTLPLAINSTVNGLVLVGLGEGLLLGVSYAVAGVPSPVLWGAATAALAIIPFDAPVTFLAAAGFLASTGNVSGAIGVAVWGSVVL